MRSENPKISVCVCTRNRPDELRRCLASIRASRLPVADTVVSDDGTDTRTAELLALGFDWVTYVDGPRQGLGANRNRALRAATGDYVLFLDDDACLGELFIEHALAALDARPADLRATTIVSGCEHNRGHVVTAHDQSFLGFQNVPYRGRKLRTIVINATLFPRELFALVRFDDQLVFGYDEVDIATQAVAHGYTIVQCDAAANWHYPSPVNRDYYRPHTEASRLYVTFKRYALHERAYAKAAAFALLAPLHCLGAALKRGEAAAVADAWRTVAAAGRHWRTARKSGRAAGAAQTRSSTA